MRDPASSAAKSRCPACSACLVLILFSPASCSSTSMRPHFDVAFFPLTNPGTVSIPLSFLAGLVGTFFGKSDEAPDKQVEMEVRALTGVGCRLEG